MQQMENEDLNWRCNACGEVYETLIEAISHTLKRTSGEHGPEGFPGKNEKTPVWPSPTEEESTVEMADEQVKQAALREFGPVGAELLQEFDPETLDIITEEDLEDVDLLNYTTEVIGDINHVRSNIQHAQRVLEIVTRHHQELFSDEVDPVEEEDESSTPELEGGNRYSTGDLQDAERSEVMRVLQSGGFLDDVSGGSTEDLPYQVFEYVYRQRTEEDNVAISEVSSHIGVPKAIIEEVLDNLSDIGVVKHNAQDDTYYVPY